MHGSPVPCVLHIRPISSSLISSNRQFVENSTNYEARHYHCYYPVNYCVKWPTLIFHMPFLTIDNLCSWEIVVKQIKRITVPRTLSKILSHEGNCAHALAAQLCLLSGHVSWKQCNHAHDPDDPDTARVSPTNVRNSQCVSCLSVCLSASLQQRKADCSSDARTGHR